MIILLQFKKGRRRQAQHSQLKKEYLLSIHHYHSEVGTFVEGESICVLNSVEQRVKVGDMVVILVEHFHVIKAIIPLTFIEVQIGNSLVGEGIERFE